MRRLTNYIKNPALFVTLFILAISIFAARQNIPETLQASVTRAAPGDVEFTPWSVPMEVAKAKPYTIMIYMNGSDLESESGAATDDLIEMLDSGLNSSSANVIIFTGGTNRWQNDVIPENECMLWQISDGEIYELASVGLVNMGNAGTLASFIDFCMQTFPADRYGLILWDHGGGSIAGYGHDEKFNNSTLTLADMEYAFNRSGLSEQKLEFLGFDSCLMGTVEMAVVAADYAKYLVASEDLTPGGGWDYSFLSVLDSDPGGEELGRAICDYFMAYYGANAEDELNISVVELSKASAVMQAMGELMRQCSDRLLDDRLSSFRTLARRRSGTKTFGLGSPRDNESDMVDIGDMAHKLSDIFPEAAREVFKALDAAVIYNRNNSAYYLSGLSAYYVYNGKAAAEESMDIYAALNMNADYTAYLQRFFDVLMSRSSVRQAVDIASTELTAWRAIDDGYFIMTGISPNATSPANTLWPSIGGIEVCLYNISDSGERTLYSSPVEVNGRDCDMIVLISDSHPTGKVLGVRYEDGFIVQKGYDTLKPGDVISFYYQTRYSGSETAHGWYKSEPFTITDTPELEWVKPKVGTIYRLRETDLQNNIRFTELD